MMAWHTKNTDLFIVLQEQNWATRQTALMLLLNVPCVCRLQYSCFYKKKNDFFYEYGLFS